MRAFCDIRGDFQLEKTGQGKPIKFIIKLYTDHNTLCVKHAPHQKAESLRVASLPGLGNTVNNNSIFNTKYPKFSIKWYKWYKSLYKCLIFCRQSLLQSSLQSY